LPVAPIKIGSRWYVRAADLAATLMPTGEVYAAPTGRAGKSLEALQITGAGLRRRGPGRPRKTAPSAATGEV
jgi:hypothetical protein